MVCQLCSNSYLAVHQPWQQQIAGGFELLVLELKDFPFINQGLGNIERLNLP
jgi:hypothetical protein